MRSSFAFPGLPRSRVFVGSVAALLGVCITAFTVGAQTRSLAPTSLRVTGAKAASTSTIAPADTNATAALLVELIRINTSNPPGNEGQIADLLAPRFRALGFEVDIIPTPQPGKAVLIARLRGNGTRKPLLLAAHADVVGVERDKWSVDPFEGVIKDGHVYGRGAIDFKGGMAVFARAAMMLAERKVPLDRDVIFLAEADEEGAQYNTGWLARDHFAKLDAEFVLNEGGWIIKGDDDRVKYVSISTADKSFLTLVLTARGTSTHSSMPQPDNAIFALSKAMARLADYETAVQLTPSTRQFFTTLAETSAPPMSTYFHNLVHGTPAQVRAADREISKDPLLHAIMRNTIAPVLLNAGFRSNVIPATAEATINLRTIPGTTTESLIAELARVVNNRRIEITVAPLASRGAVPATTPSPAAPPPPTAANIPESSTSTSLYLALEREAKAQFPGVRVTPYLFQAATDAGAWRSRGIPVYGIYPYAITADELKRMHGNDERVSVESLRQGTEMIFRTLVSVAGSH